MSLAASCKPVVFASLLLSLAFTAGPADGGEAEGALDWTVVQGAVARVQILDAKGAVLRETYGTVLGEPVDLVVPLADIQGGAKAVAAFSGGLTLSASSVLRIDPIHGLALLDLQGEPPQPPTPDETIKWRMAETIYVIPGPGMVSAAAKGTSTEPFHLDQLRIVPMTGQHPAGLPVMHSCGRWIGLTGALRDPGGERTFLIPKESIYPLLFGEQAAKPIEGLSWTAPAWVDPLTAEGSLARGVLIAYEKPEDAVPVLDRALQKNRSLPEVHYWIGKNAFRRQQFTDAEASYLEAARLRPDWGMAFYLAGAAANQAGGYDRALQHYDKAIALEPANPMFLNNRWGALFNLGRLEEGVAALKRALEIDPAYGMAMFNLSITYNRMGKRTEAEEQYNALLAVDKTLAANLRKKLDE